MQRSAPGIDVWALTIRFTNSIPQTSTALEVARTAVRIALTFVPVILIKNHKIKRKLKYAEAKGDTALAEKVRAMRTKTVFFHGILFIPVLIFWATILASLERTPLTGRYVLIIRFRDFATA